MPPIPSSEDTPLSSTLALKISAEQTAVILIMFAGVGVLVLLLQCYRYFFRTHGQYYAETAVWLVVYWKPHILPLFLTGGEVVAGRQEEAPGGNPPAVSNK